MKKTAYILILLFYSLNVAAINKDSLFLDNAKKFFNKELGIELYGQFYTIRDNTVHPLLFVSSADKVEFPLGKVIRLISYQAKLDSEYKARGYETFCYTKPNSNSKCYLTDNFLLYSNEAKAFVMFHEFMHNYFVQKKIRIPYDYEESICDIIGNYVSLDFAKSNNFLDLNLIQRQISINEKIYRIINGSIVKVNNRPEIRNKYHTECYNKIQKQLKNANGFQKDRFNYTVNNAFLLKNKTYSDNYFLLKKVLLKAKTIEKFIAIIDSLPNNDNDCKKYLEQYE